MKISNTAPLHLSNREVLSHFLALKQETDHLQSLISSSKSRNAQAMRAKYPLKDDQKMTFEDAPVGDDLPGEDHAVRRGVSGDLVWIQDEMIKYLCGEDQPTARQTEEGVARLTDELQDHGLTKGEVLMIVNLAPVQPVELYCIIEEVDTRFLPDPPERLEVIGAQVSETLLDHYPDDLRASGHLPGAHDAGADKEFIDPGITAEEDFIHEAEWGRDKEDGVGEERENDME